MSKDFYYRNINAKETDYKPRRKITGFNNWLKNKTAARPDDDRFVQMFFKTIIAAGPLTKFGPTDAVIKKVARLGNMSNTKGISMPLYVNGDSPKFGPGNPAMGTYRDEADRLPRRERGKTVATRNETDQLTLGKHGTTGENASDSDTKTKSATIQLDQKLYKDVHPIHPPYEMLQETVRNASYRAIMYQCECRAIQGCDDYPLDLGCLFVGKGAKACVDRGIAYECTLEQALAHIDRAKECGLSAVAYFVEVEEYAWGWHDEDMPNVMEICFCCPCCCSAVRFENRAGGELKGILHQGSGWSCVVDLDKCIGCGQCAEVCPHERMHFDPVLRRPVVHANCAGCGQCLKYCPTGALSVVQTGPTHEHTEDYFEKLHAVY